MLSLMKTFGTYAVSGLAVTLMASGCSLQAKSGPPSLHFDLRSLAQQDSVNGITLATNGFEDFACFAINVTGPGIDDSDPYRTDKDPAKDFQRTLGGSPCAYRGIVSPPIYISSTSAMQGELALKLPPGSIRMVQLVGVKNLESCKNGFIDPLDANQSLQNYYELGRAEVRDFFQDRSVALPLAAWSTLTAAEQEARNMDSCEGGTNGGGDTVAPVVTITNPVATLVTSASLTVSGISPNEAIANYCILVNSASSTGCTWIAGTLPPSLTVTMSDSHEGTLNKVSIWAKDAAGNVSARADTNTFEYDSSTLVPTISPAQIAVAPGGTGQVNVTITPGASFYQMICLIDDGLSSPISPGACTWIPKATSYTHNATNSGNVYIHVFVKDSFGQVSTHSVSTQVAVGI